MKKLIKRLGEIAKKGSKDNKGFTLVELIVVIAILGILTVVGITGYSKYIGKSKESTDKAACDTLKSAIINATAEEDVYDEIKKLSDNTAVEIDIPQPASGASAPTSIAALANGKLPKLLGHVDKALGNEIPTPKQSGYKFHIVITPDKDEGTITVKVTAVEA